MLTAVMVPLNIPFKGVSSQGDSENRGTLEVGKWADLVVLDRNPREVGLLELTSLKVLQTFVGGEDKVGKKTPLKPT